MKVGTKIGAIVMVVMLFASLMLTGCSNEAMPTAKELLDGYQTMLDEHTGRTYDGHIEMGLQTYMYGNGEQTNAYSDVQIQEVKDTATRMTSDNTTVYATKTQKVDSMGNAIGDPEETQSEEKSVTDTYLVKDEDAYVAYTQAEDKWYKMDSDSLTVFDAMFVNDEQFLPAFTVTKNTGEYVVAGELELADIKPMLSTFIPVDEIIGDSMSLISLDDLPKVKLEYRFNANSRELTKVSVELKDTMQTLFDRVKNLMIQLYAISENGSSLDGSTNAIGSLNPDDLVFLVSRANMTFSNIQFADALSIEVPVEAIETAEPYTGVITDVSGDEDITG